MARKTEEEKAIEAAQKEAQRQDAHRQQQEAAYWASPVGRADAAYRTGAMFFQVDIPHTSLTGSTNAAWGVRTQAQQRQHGPATDVLGQIEHVGWRLEQASWVYVQTGQNSRDKFMASGQHVVVTGQVIGIYLFRRDNGLTR
jgi:hypothetical protein